MDVADWLKGLGLEQYEPAFSENRIDGDLLPKLTPEDLRDLGVTLVGDRRRLLDAIAALRERGGASEPAAPEQRSRPRRRSGGRSPSCFAISLIPQPSPHGSTPRTCGRSSRLFSAPSPRRSGNSTVSWPSTWATAC